MKRSLNDGYDSRDVFISPSGIIAMINRAINRRHDSRDDINNPIEITEMIKIMMFWVLVKSYCDLLRCIQDYYIITSLRSCPLPVIPDCRLHHHMNHHS